MNGYVIILCALLHTISPLSLASPDASGPTRLRIGYDYQPPYRYTDENLNAVGIDIDRISAILDAAGVSYSFHPYPWKRILLNIERGSIDIALSAGRLKEREKYALFSNSIFRYGSNALFVSNEYIEHFANFDELSDLKPLPVWIGVRRAASYSDEYEKLLEDTVFAEKLVVLNDIPQSIKLALSKRIQGFIASPNMVNYELRNLCFRSKFTMVYDLSHSKKVETFLMFSRKTVSPALVNEIDRAMLLVNSADNKYEASYFVDYPSCSS